MEKEVIENKQVLASLNELMILPTTGSSSSADSSEDDAKHSCLIQTRFLILYMVLDWLDRQKRIFEFHFDLRRSPRSLQQHQANCNEEV
jgi:hypothetical protein